MSRKKNKQQKSTEAWKRVYTNVFKHKDLKKFQHEITVTTKNYGSCSGFMWYSVRQFVFHKIVLPEWLSNTNVNYRNNKLEEVKRYLGTGLAAELQLTSNKRTW